MRHAKRNQRLSRPSEQREALLDSLVRGLVVRGQITTTHARAKEAQRLAERLVTWGKEGSIASRRRAFRVLQDRTLVRQLFTDIAPRFMDSPSGFTRVMRLSRRRGDGAEQSLLAFSRLPAAQPAVPAGARPAPAPKAPTTPQRPESKPRDKKDEAKKPQRLFEGLRKFWTRKGRGSTSP